MPGKPVFDLGALWNAQVEATEGAVYALRCVCKSKNLIPRMWAQTTEEGAPKDKTRFLFIAHDAKGLIKYLDVALIPDPTGLAEQVKVSELLREAHFAEKRIRAGLDRLDKGLDPIPKEEAKAVLSLN
jgi:hypothetical protein